MAVLRSQPVAESLPCRHLRSRTSTGPAGSRDLNPTRPAPLPPRTLATSSRSRRGACFIQMDPLRYVRLPGPCGKDRRRTRAMAVPRTWVGSAATPIPCWSPACWASP